LTREIATPGKGSEAITSFRFLEREAYLIFGIDDSEIGIEGRPHTLLAAMGVRDPEKLESALVTLKNDFGLRASEEVKWNGMPALPQKTREELSRELMILLHDSVPLVVINEGRDKNQAAQASARQIADFLAICSSLAPGETIHLLFDESIIDDQIEFKRYLRTLSPSGIAAAGVESVHSHEHAVIQIADVLAGFSRLATEIALGREDKQITVWDDGFGSDIPTSLLTYISQGLRWATWGEVPPPPDPNDVKFDATWPFKTVGGFGLRIHSSISPQTVEVIYKSRTVYMGCLH
jgi:hypothetical protein